MEQLLDEYNYYYTEDALDKIIDEWASQKAELITAFKKHPNYLAGKFMIAFDYDYERVCDRKQAVRFGDWVCQYPVRDCRRNIPEEIERQRIKEGTSYLPNGIFYLFYYMSHFTDRTISEEAAKEINTFLPTIHAHAGQKTSRVVNKICCYLGYDKHPDYNREFAKFADSLSPLIIRRHTILSLNPLDYLTMSFGNSWASCHTIDKHNRRGMPNSYEGQYSSGTMSYMLDPSSMVFYTVDAAYEGNEYWTQPKIHRQMFHWGAWKLVQGRLYPQSNDGDRGAGAPYRHLVQEIISTIFDVPNLWSVKHGTSHASYYIQTRGTHYADYCNFSDCNLSYLKDKQNIEEFVVGAEPICIECGLRHDTGDNINCCRSYDERYYCADCGCEIDEEDLIWIGDEPYCRGCVTYCKRCGCYELNNDAVYVDSEDIYVCVSCYNAYYSRCIHCGEVYRDNELHWHATDHTAIVATTN